MQCLLRHHQFPGMPEKQLLVGVTEFENSVTARIKNGVYSGRAAIDTI
jgi:hypothetical protein